MRIPSNSLTLNQGGNMTIWGRWKNKKPEKLDSCKKSDASYLVREYQMAFGKDWKIWVGRMKDEPR